MFPSQTVPAWEWNQRLSGSNYGASFLFVNFFKCQFPKFHPHLKIKHLTRSWDGFWNLRLKVLEMQEQMFDAFRDAFRSKEMIFSSYEAVKTTGASRCCFHSSARCGTSGWLLAPFHPSTDSAAELNHKLHLNGGWKVTLLRAVMNYPLQTGSKVKQRTSGGNSQRIHRSTAIYLGFCSSGCWRTRPRPWLCAVAHCERDAEVIKSLII